MNFEGGDVKARKVEDPKYGGTSQYTRAKMNDKANKAPVDTLEAVRLLKELVEEGFSFVPMLHILDTFPVSLAGLKAVLQVGGWPR